MTWTLISFLPLLAMAFFVGGQLMLVVAVVLAVREEHAEISASCSARMFL